MASSTFLGQYDKRDVRNAYAFLTPLILVMVFFILIPVIGTILYSFVILENGRESLGISNYAEVLFGPIYSETFWAAVRFTLLFTITTVGLEAIIGMAFALVLNESFPGRGIVRTVILIPWAIPTVVSALMWKTIYDPSYGLMKFIFVLFGAEPSSINMLGDFTSAFWALVIADIWKTTPFVVIILLSGLQAIPQDLYKQARIDGAKMFKQFASITLPLVMPVLVIALIFRTIDAVRVFDLIQVLTRGGQGTMALSHIGYNNYTVDLGIFSTISVLTFVIAFPDYDHLHQIRAIWPTP